ncbi:cell division suppressor protein YneA [Pseudobacillus wudalianchiensis]|uniref:LysM domain-containing protein n=1 Tax=Pseudobacillus wudalianchiensis TaxID=1743143 RepID=A0A1B9AIS8_9BACI|nr:LysM peptidoglycan-binding domain-containing protein [Bacillus wudalianchiensis]OCA83742.1 hypothetical protein A8F95_12110 [Bacillus wudalianchiensis]
MVKVFVKENFFVLLFMTVTIIAGIMLIFSVSEDQIPYKEITVQEGDSLWSIAKEYNSGQEMKEEDFIMWVQKENRLHSVKILPGDTLVIPIVSHSSHTGGQVAFKGE